MYEKIHKCIFIFILFIFSISGFGCKSTKVLPDNRNGIEEHRELQSDIRDGETELAITGSKIESASDQLEKRIRELEDRIRELEQTIRDSKTNEQALGELVQQIRTREITRDKLIELGIEFNKTEESENKN